MAIGRPSTCPLQAVRAAGPRRRSRTCSSTVPFARSALSSSQAQADTRAVGINLQNFETIGLADLHGVFVHDSPVGEWLGGGLAEASASGAATALAG